MDAGGAGLSVEDDGQDDRKQSGQQVDQHGHHELLEVAVFIGELEHGQLESDGAVVGQ